MDACVATTRTLLLVHAASALINDPRITSMYVCVRARARINVFSCVHTYIYIRIYVHIRNTKMHT